MFSVGEAGMREVVRVAASKPFHRHFFVMLGFGLMRRTDCLTLQIRSGTVEEMAEETVGFPS